MPPPCRNGRNLETVTNADCVAKGTGRRDGSLGNGSVFAT